MRIVLTHEQKVAHQFLSAFDTTESRLTSSLVLLEKTESQRTSITGSIEGMPMSSAQKDKMLTALSRMDDSIDKIEELSGIYADQFAEIEEFISAVQKQDKQAGKVLRFAYLHGMAVGDIANHEELNCSKKTVYEHLKRGLDIAYDLILEG